MAALNNIWFTTTIGGEATESVVNKCRATIVKTPPATNVANAVTVSKWAIRVTEV